MFFLRMGFAKVRNYVRRASSSLACLILCFRVCVRIYFAAMRLSSGKKYLLSCCLLCVRCSFWAFWPRNFVVPMIFCAVTCKADTMIALAFSAYWVALILPCWKLFLRAWMTCSTLLAWSSRASENFCQTAVSLSLDDRNWVRGESSWAVGMLPVLCVADFAERHSWRTIRLWSVGGPDLIWGYERVLVSHSRFWLLENTVLL